MPRITCRQPSTGKPLNIQSNNVGTAFTTIAEAPDFSVPDPSGSQYVDRDPTNPTRGIAAGELLFLTPLLAYNKTGTARWIDVRFLSESGAINDALGRFTVPAGETLAIPMQGRSLVKRSAMGANGDRIQVRAEIASAFEVWASASEQASAEHVGVIA